MSEISFSFKNLDEERALFGHLDRNLRFLRAAHDVDAVSRGGKLTISGDPEKVEQAAQKVERALRLLRENASQSVDISEIFQNAPVAPAYTQQDRQKSVGAVRWIVKPKTANQEKYMQAIQDHSVTFGIGPAGTGKTFLAVAMAVSFIQSGLFRRLVLTRPAVEAGENLGFLPGDLEAKVNPYLRPLYDALDDLLPRGMLKRYMEEGIVEVSPLAYMRGRTLDHSLIILDEAQNTTPAQMKMFLTRMGFDSKIIVTGDVTQIDLAPGKTSGLILASRILRRVEGLSFCYLGQNDIVRHPVVQRIVKAYNAWEERQEITDDSPPAGQDTGGAPARSDEERERLPDGASGRRDHRNPRRES